MRNIWRTAFGLGLLLQPVEMGWQSPASGKHPVAVALPGQPGSIRFAVIGDMGTGEHEQFEIAARMAEFHLQLPFGFVLTVGDNIYGGKSDADLRRKFEIPYWPLLRAGVPFYATLGNHDDSAERHYKWFHMDGKNYYAFTRGNIRFLALDSNTPDAEQLAWLSHELESAREAWKICYFHHPLYSSAAYHGSAEGLRELLEPLFVRYGVQVVLAGHEHVYERVRPQKSVHYFTEGASGELRRGDLRPGALTAVGFDNEQSFLAFEIGGDDLYFQAISRSGQTVDSGMIRR